MYKGLRRLIRELFALFTLSSVYDYFFHVIRMTAFYFMYA